MLWIYKWIVVKLHKFPQISRQQLNDTFVDMKARYQRSEKSLRAVYEHQLLAAMAMNDRTVAEEAR